MEVKEPTSIELIFISFFSRRGTFAIEQHGQGLAKKQIDWK